MKATLDIPDDLYRRVKARSALEGRPLRAVAIELFQSWLRAGMPDEKNSATPVPNGQDLADFPWLEISQKYMKPGISHGMEDIRRSISRGWAEEVAKTLTPNQPES